MFNSNYSVFGVDPTMSQFRAQIGYAITSADEVMELRRKIAAAEAETSGLRESLANADRQQEDRDRKTAESVAALAERVERIAKGLAAV